MEMLTPDLTKMLANSVLPVRTKGLAPLLLSLLVNAQLMGLPEDPTNFVLGTFVGMTFS